MCITKSWPWCVHRLIFKVHEDRERLSVCEETFFLESTKNKRLIKGSSATSSGLWVGIDAGGGSEADHLKRFTGSLMVAG